MFLVPEDFGSFALEIPVARYGFVYSDGLRQGQTHMASKGTTKIEKGFATKSSGTISHYVILHPSTSLILHPNPSYPRLKLSHVLVLFRQLVRPGSQHSSTNRSLVFDPNHSPHPKFNGLVQIGLMQN